MNKGIKKQLFKHDGFQSFQVFSNKNIISQGFLKHFGELLVFF